MSQLKNIRLSNYNLKGPRFKDSCYSTTTLPTLRNRIMPANHVDVETDLRMGQGAKVSYESASIDNSRSWLDMLTGRGGPQECDFDPHYTRDDYNDIKEISYYRPNIIRDPQAHLQNDPRHDRANFGINTREFARKYYA